MNTDTNSIFAPSTYHRFTNLASFVASAVMTWAGVDAMDPVIALVGGLILVLSSFGLFFQREGKPARSGARAKVHDFFHSKRRSVSLLLFVVSAVTFWHAIDVHAVLAAVAGAPLLVATAFDMFKVRAAA
ncbi:hypothetical protein [Rubrivivax gelatinosus]|uniref:hypothetical protein n=1 Tax=Rubrivivax gelatinosus TaxID=28068 RepID=UPI00030516EF|nr:hypothetical protein [Rubrivivax gelatinosus]MBG6083121.1 hypothetical protein [Rubrivivax gelatinosus]